MPTTLDVTCENCGRPDRITVPDHHPEGERLAWECPELAPTGDDYDADGNRSRRKGVDGCGHKNFTDGAHPAAAQGIPAAEGATLVVDGDHGHTVDNGAAG